MSVRLSIQKNLVEHQMYSDFQKIVLSIVAGLQTSEDQLATIQAEFIRLDQDKNGTLNREELSHMTSGQLCETYDLNWEEIITSCDYNGDGVIDFEEFITACVDKKVLKSHEDVRKAFNVLDYNKDGVISLEDFDDLFNSYGGAVIDAQMWEDLLAEADTNDDGMISFVEFK